MTIYQRVDAVLVDEDGVFALTELTRVSGLEERILRELIDNEILDIKVEEGDLYRVSPEALVKACRAARLARDFELAAPGVALAVRLLERIDALERQIVMGGTRSRPQ